MLRRVNEHWWILEYEGVEGRYVWFAQSQGEVSHKFGVWLKQTGRRRVAQ